MSGQQPRDDPRRRSDRQSADRYSDVFASFNSPDSNIALNAPGGAPTSPRASYPSPRVAAAASSARNSVGMTPSSSSATAISASTSSAMTASESHGSSVSSAAAADTTPRLSAAWQPTPTAGSNAAAAARTGSAAHSSTSHGSSADAYAARPAASSAANAPVRRRQGESIDISSDSHPLAGDVDEGHTPRAGQYATMGGSGAGKRDSYQPLISPPRGPNGSPPLSPPASYASLMPAPSSSQMGFSRNSIASSLGGAYSAVPLADGSANDPYGMYATPPPMLGRDRRSSSFMSYPQRPGTPGTPGSMGTTLLGTPGGLKPESIRSDSRYSGLYDPGNRLSVASGSIYGLLDEAKTPHGHADEAGAGAGDGAYFSRKQQEYLAQGPKSGLASATSTPGGGTYAEGGRGYADYSSPGGSAASKANPPGKRRYAGLGDGSGGRRGLFGLQRRTEKWRENRPHYSKRKKACIIGVIALIIIAIIVAVVVPITHSLSGSDPSRPADPVDSSTGQPVDGGEITNDQGAHVATTGGDGSTVMLEDGSSFTYRNPFGGFWVSGLLNNSAQAQSYTPPLSQEFYFGAGGRYSKRQGPTNGTAEGRILGVNLGGWLVLEPFIVPAPFEQYSNTSNPALDEFDLSTRYRAEGGEANLRAKLVAHYDSFITERDFAAIAGAGLNWVRLPIGFWAVETIEGEPFLEGVSWQYFLKAIKWARKYGLRINLDIHALPGSVNSYNHGGKLGNFQTGINWLNGPMGLANAQRSINILREIAEFISQPDIRPVVPMLTIINEPNLPQGIGQDNLQRWYADIYSMIRNNITGLGDGHGPYIAPHDGFIGLQAWESFLPGADRISWDVHPYIAFTPPYTSSWNELVPRICNYFGPMMDRAQANMGVSFAGEWSLAVNDCGLWLNGVNLGTRYEGTYQGTTVYGSCDTWTNWPAFDDNMKTGLRQFAQSSFDSLKHGFFWTWKIGNSTVTGRVMAPQWSYSLGLEQGWIPSNPYRETVGACQQAAQNFGASIAATPSWSSTYYGWQTGSSVSPNTANPSQYPWPPTTMNNVNTPISNLPSYTLTGPITKLPTPTYTESQKGKAAPTISDWANNADNGPFYAKIQGCTYATNQYMVTSVPGTWPCTGNAAPAKRAPSPTPVPTGYA